MEKNTLLQELKSKIIDGEISQQEVLDAINYQETSPDKSLKSFSQQTVSRLLYILGAAVVAIGLFIFFWQIWGNIGSFMRIFVTLGFGLLTAGIGSFLLLESNGRKLGAIFHIIGGLLIPGGALVALTEIVGNTTNRWSETIAFFVIFLFYLLLESVHKHAVLTFFALINGTIFANLFLVALFEPSILSSDLYVYFTMVMGAVYILLGQSFKDGHNRSLIGFVYFFGSSGILAAGFYFVTQYLLWQLLYPFTAIGGLLLAVYLRSRGILIMSTIFLIIYISYITGEYFANSLGWPVILIFLGFVFIGLGYMSFTINKKYIKSQR